MRIKKNDARKGKEKKGDTERGKKRMKGKKGILIKIIRNDGK